MPRSSRSKTSVPSRRQLANFSALKVAPSSPSAETAKPRRPSPTAVARHAFIESEDRIEGGSAAGKGNRGAREPEHSREHRPGTQRDCECPRANAHLAPAEQFRTALRGHTSGSHVPHVRRSSTDPRLIESSP